MKGVERYFKVNAAAWLAGAYGDNPRSYPAAKHRMRLAVRALKPVAKRGARLLELACGGAHLSAEWTRLGGCAVAVDRSPDMLKAARERLNGLRAEVLEGDVLRVELPPGKFDAATALGLLEYLPDDDALLRRARKHVRKGGLFLVDFRNRLFNLFSISAYTRKELKNRSAGLVDEIQTLYQPLPEAKTRAYLRELGKRAKKLASAKTLAVKPETAGFKGSLDGRQHTPEEARALGKRHGFETVAFYGIHPHLSTPKLNRLLPVPAYNSLSDSLLVFEDEPASLLWSSKFLAVYRRK